jgi:hypothetical protein
MAIPLKKCTPVFFAILMGCNDYSEDWTVLDKRPNAMPLNYAAIQRNFDGMVYGASGFELTPGKAVHYNVTASGNVLDLHDVEITAWLDVNGKPFPVGCQDLTCTPEPGDPVVVVKKKGPPWVFNIVFE